jgi:hypothetical protein
MNIEQALKWKAALIPAQGFNVVAIDDMGDPDDHGPYLVAHFATQDEADRARVEHAKRTGESCYVYGSNGNGAE